MSIIRKSWDSFRKAVIHPKAGEDQIQHMRWAYYAGASAVLEVATRIGEPDVSEELGVMTLESMDVEIRKFKEEIGGHA